MRTCVQPFSSIGSRGTLGLGLPRRNFGFSLIEAIVTLATFALIATVIVPKVYDTKTSVYRISNDRQRQLEVKKFAGQLLSDPSKYQVLWNKTESARCAKLKDLPWGFDGVHMVDLKTCPECPGRFGFVIQPHPLDLLNGAVMVATLRVVHPQILAGQKVLCDGETVENAEEMTLIMSPR